MKDFSRIVVIGGLVAGLAIAGCKKQEAAPAAPAPSAEAAPANEVSNVPPLHENNIVSIALGSKDHTTLVAALKAADYVTSVAASGPLTVFAPTNDAFAKLPEGTVENLVKPEN
ncbi:MAG: fasciclin domain-containing protein, partial [Polyangiales bacterium]